jgi:hypothetical protein
MQRICINNSFLLSVGSILHGKLFTNGWRNSLKDIRKSETLLAPVWKWLRQQSKDFYEADFSALVKRWDKCISVGGGYVQK